MSSKNKKPVTTEELIDIACLLAQELEDFISEAESAGCDAPFPGTRALLDDWEAIYKRTGYEWKQAILNSDVESTLILGEL